MSGNQDEQKEAEPGGRSHGGDIQDEIHLGEGKQGEGHLQGGGKYQGGGKPRPYITGNSSNVGAGLAPALQPTQFTPALQPTQHAPALQPTQHAPALQPT